MKSMIDPKFRHATFFFGRANLLQGTVLHVPAAPGECWIVEDADGKIHFVQTFERMELGALGGHGND